VIGFWIAGCWVGAKYDVEMRGPLKGFLITMLIREIHGGFLYRWHNLLSLLLFLIVLYTLSFLLCLFHCVTSRLLQYTIQSFSCRYTCLSSCFTIWYFYISLASNKYIYPSCISKRVPATAYQSASHKVKQ